MIVRNTARSSADSPASASCSTSVRAAPTRSATARTEVLQGALAGLSAEERAVLRTIMGKILVGLMREPGAVRWMCRLCDIGVCRGAEGGCPVGNAARERYLS